MIGSSWGLVSIGGDLPARESQITLTFGADRQATGHAGVNRYFSAYTIAKPDQGAGALGFGDLGSTRMAGPPELMEQEREYLDRLRAVDGYHAGGGLLELSSAGRPLLRFRQISSTQP
jgi:heat shock protein HslJ